MVRKLDCVREIKSMGLHAFSNVDFPHKFPYKINMGLCRATACRGMIMIYDNEDWTSIL